LQPFGRLGWGAAFLFVICGALRLARYNVQMATEENKSFVGLPIPAAGTILASLVLFYNELFGALGGKNFILLFLPFLLAALMVSTIRFYSIKVLDFKNRKPFWLLIVVAVAFVFIFMYPEIVIFIVSIIYMLLGIIEGTLLFRKKRHLKKTEK